MTAHVQRVAKLLALHTALVKQQEVHAAKAKLDLDMAAQEERDTLSLLGSPVFQGNLAAVPLRHAERLRQTIQLLKARGAAAEAELQALNAKVRLLSRLHAKAKAETQSAVDAKELERIGEKFLLQPRTSPDR